VDGGWLYPVLFLTATAAGFVDSIAGGGGLITIPVLLSLGLAPPDALGTNKLQATFGSGSAAWHYGRAGLFDLRDCRVGIVCTGLGALAGALVVLRLSPAFLRRLIPWLLVLLAIYFLVRPKLGDHDSPPRLRPAYFHVIFGLGLGFYDGFFGPGAGSFWAMAYLLGLGFNLTRATAYTKVMNFTSNVGSLAVFLWLNHFVLAAGLVMGLGQFAGARLGSKVVIRKGTRFIRPVFITVVLALTGKLLYENWK
jgi:uncharacterized protein